MAPRPCAAMACGSRPFAETLVKTHDRAILVLLLNPATRGPPLSKASAEMSAFRS